MNADSCKIPKTVALIAAREDATRDILIQLAEQGLAAARRLLGRIAQLSDFETCETTLYGEASSRVHAVQTHSNRLLGLVRAADSIAGSAMSLDDLAAAEGIRHPILGELCSLACQGATMARKVNTAWLQERERILQTNELKSFRFQVAVAQVRNELRRQAAEVVTTDEPAEEPAAA